MAFLLAAGALGVRIVREAPLSLHLPPTIVTNGASGSRAVAPFLIFLGEVRQAIPEGATVRIVAPQSPTGDIFMNFEIAVGQLPRQQVRRQDAPAERAEYVAVYGAPAFAAGRLLRRFDGGDLYWTGK